MGKKKRAEPTVNASSMADIAFLLLIFFLVTTTIASDRGMPMLLPPKKSDTPPTPLNDRNLFLIQINSRNELLIEKEPGSAEQIKEQVKKFLTNNGADPKSSESPKTAVVSIKADRGTDYKTYITVLDQIKAAYHELRAEAVGISIEEYLDLDTKKNPSHKATFDKAKEFYPMQISEAEPTKIGS